MSQPPWGSGGPGGSAPGGPPPQGYGPPPNYHAPSQGYGPPPNYGSAPNRGPDYGPGQGYGAGQGYFPAQGQPPHGTAAYGPTRGVGIPGVVIAAVGGLIMAVGFFAPWYSVGGQSSYLKDASKAASLDGVSALPAVYFGWLLWVLFALTVVAAFVACLPTGASIAMRIIAPLLGVLGVALLFAALNTDRPAGAPGPFEHASIGLFATIIGFLVVGVGGVFGPSSRR